MHCIFRLQKESKSFDEPFWRNCIFIFSWLNYEGSIVKIPDRKTGKMTFSALKWTYLRLQLLKTSQTGLKIPVLSIQKKISPTLFPKLALNLQKLRFKFKIRLKINLFFQWNGHISGYTCLKLLWLVSKFSYCSNEKMFLLHFFSKNVSKPFKNAI